MYCLANYILLRFRKGSKPLFFTTVRGVRVRGQFESLMYFYRSFGCGWGEALAQSNEQTTIKIKTTWDTTTNNIDASQADLGREKISLLLGSMTDDYDNACTHTYWDVMFAAMRKWYQTWYMNTSQYCMGHEHVCITAALTYKLFWRTALSYLIVLNKYDIVVYKYTSQPVIYACAEGHIPAYPH